jgi:hypothetical protein
MPFVKLSNVKKAYEWELERRKKEHEKKKLLKEKLLKKIKEKQNEKNLMEQRS